MRCLAGDDMSGAGQLYLLTMKNIIERLKQFVTQYRYLIIATLLAMMVLEYCHIQQMKQLNPYAPAEQPCMPEPQTLSDVAVDPAAEPQSTDGSWLLWLPMAALAVLTVLLARARRRGQDPLQDFLDRFRKVSVRGRLWQDLQGRVVFTLTVSNRKQGASVQFEVPTVEFMALRSRRKFRVPAPDFPITLSGGTSHTVNVSLQRLMAAHPELLSYSVIRMTVAADNGRTYKTRPVVVRWQKR